MTIEKSDSQQRFEKRKQKVANKYSKEVEEFSIKEKSEIEDGIVINRGLSDVVCSFIFIALIVWMV